MSHELICSWLEIPAGKWPPEPHVLLGLEPGDRDRQRIEQQVHARLEVVRRYQLAHPELVTEAMNRLAQALVCLTESPARPSDADVSPAAPPEEPSPPAPGQSIDVPRAEPATKSEAVDWRPARRELGTKRALYHRLARTRRLLHNWRRLGRYLRRPGRALHGPAETTDLQRQLATFLKLLRDFPPLLGAAGQPGSVVAALAHQSAVGAAFPSLPPSQREHLARDWQAVRALLTAQARFLRREARRMRRKNVVIRVLQAVSLERPGILLLIVAGLALALALAQYFSARP